MQVQQSSRQQLVPLYMIFSIVMCCLVLLLSSCAASQASNASTPTPTKPTPTVQPKGDSNGSPTEAVLRAQLAKVQQIMAKMSLEQKLGQLIIVEYIGNSYHDTSLQYMISQQYVGGFMYQESNHNFDSPYNVASNANALSLQAMKDAQIPLIIATDQEGGLVNRLYKFHGYLPAAADMAATGDPNVALTQGTQAARWMLELGINTDLAPVVDVHTVNPPILESRMFGSDPKTVATYAGAYLTGLQKNGVAACLKHFPGLGAVNSDPHAGLPRVGRSMAGLENIDLAPYKLMIQKYHPAMIMSTDVLMPAIDPSLPAELSPDTITGILRNQLGYNGVVITDGLYMAGISSQWTLSQAAVLSIIAGNDLIEGPYMPNQVADMVVAFKQAMHQGKLTMERINQAVEHILFLKVQYNIIK